MKVFAILSVLLFTSLSICGQSVCPLTNFSYEIVRSDPSSFYIQIKKPAHFNDLFQLFVNDELIPEPAKINDDGFFYGPFEAICNLNYHFYISAFDNDACAIKINIGPVCFENEECRFYDIEYEILSCDDQNVKMTLDFKHKNTLNLGFNLFDANNNFIGFFKYDDLPISFLYTRNNTGTGQLTIKEDDNESCATSFNFTINCNPNEDCKIYDVKYDLIECSDANASYLVIDFEHRNTPSSSFKIKGNGVNYGTFKYEQLPIRLGPIEENCEKPLEFIIYDSENLNCKYIIDNVNICCNPGCLLPIFEIINTECSPEKINIKLKLFNETAANALSVLINDRAINDFHFNFPYMYINIPNTLSSSEHILTICYNNSNSDDCCYSQRFSLNDCNNGSECKIGIPKITPSDCISTDVNYVIIDFEYANNGSKGFTVKGNGNNYGEFKYEQLPIRIPLEFICDKSYEFVIIDNEFPNCSNFIEYGTLCCDSECSFFPKDISIKCDDNLLTEIAFYLFEATDPIKSYQIFINDILIAETSKNNEFLEFATLLPIDENTEFKLTICDEECCITESLDLSECANVQPPCVIENIMIKDLSCANSGLNFILDFDHQGTNAETFVLYSYRGFHSVHKYKDLPIKIENFPFIPIGNYNALVICDGDSFCCGAHVFEQPQCLITGNNNTTTAEFNHNYIKQNPVTNSLFLNSPFKSNLYQILDGNGNILKNIPAKYYSSEIDISQLNSGLYFLRITNENGISSQKFIITK